MARNPKKAPHAAIVLAAGKGTRMKSGLAKVLHAANGRPLVYYPVERALALGCSPVVVVVGHQGDEVRRELTAWFPGANLRFAVQEQQIGTAHAVLAAKRALRGHAGRLLILYGDVPLLTGESLRRLIAGARRSRVAFLTMRPADPTGYGRVVRDERGRAVAIVEHKDATPEQRELRECNAGIYDVEAAFLWKALARVGSRNRQRELYLTDVVATAAAGGAEVPAIDTPVAEVAGVNDRVELAEVGRVLRLRVAERHLRAGVTMLDPATTWVEPGVELGTDVILEPGVRLAGATRIGSGSRIGTGCLVSGSVLGEGVQLKPYSVLEDAVVGAGAIVGPFARLRPGTELAEGVHIGNFVETKKTRIGKGSKANHLAYLGDAVIGARCNVGAGTITCNYDGVHKHPTVLGDEVFIGSDTQLVAPVTVGDGAYVGAGSTVTQDVPAWSLSLSRAPQVTKEGWVKRRRAAQARAKAKAKAVIGPGAASAPRPGARGPGRRSPPGRRRR